MLAGNPPYEPPALSDYDLLETEILTGSQASVVFNDLNSTYGADYQQLQIRMSVRSTRSALADSVDITFNGASSTYSWHALRGSGSSAESYGVLSNSYMQAGLIPGNTNVSGNFGALVTDILDPFESTKNTSQKTFWGMYGSNENFLGVFSGAWYSTNVLTSVTLDCSNASFIAGSRFSLYGLKAA
jgi:hypothetical protein